MKMTNKTKKRTHAAGPSFDVSPDDADIIHDIVSRAMKMATKIGGFHYPRMDCEMDLMACHASGNPLRLADLLRADDGNFAHDIFGIREHLDRETGKLGRCFVPRFTARTSTGKASGS